MIEPTESFSKKELDEFVEVLVGIHRLLEENPEVLTTAPHFTPVRKVDEVGANKSLILSGAIKTLPDLPRNRIEPGQLKEMGTEKNLAEILKAHKERRA